MGRKHISELPIHFIFNEHDWIEIIVDNSEDDGYISTRIGVRCKNCNLTAMQDVGSLGYFVVEKIKSEMTCEEIQIKSIIE